MDYRFFFSPTFFIIVVDTFGTHVNMIDIIFQVVFFQLLIAQIKHIFCRAIIGLKVGIQKR